MKKAKIDPGPGQIKKFLLDAHEHHRFTIRMQNAVRVLGKCQDRGKGVFFFCLQYPITQKFLVAKMEPIEIPKRQDDGLG